MFITQPSGAVEQTVGYTSLDSRKGSRQCYKFRSNPHIETLKSYLKYDIIQQGI